MAKIIVTLVSKETIPNFLFIKSFSDAEKYLFISTDQMEDAEKGNKREWIIKAAGISDEKHDKIIVDAERKESVIKELSSYKWDDYSDIIVNITGGTKMMSIATYEFFKDKTDQLWYLPIGKNEYHLCDNSSEKKKIQYQMSVEEYLACCGILKEEMRYSEKQPLFEERNVINFFNQFKLKDFDFCMLEEIRLKFRDDKAPFKNEIARKKKIDLNLLEDIEPIKSFLNTINFPIKNGILTKNQMEFLTGGWFEEFCYYCFKKILNCEDKHLKIGVVLDPKQGDKEKAKYFTNNDLDVVLVYNNVFYVIECKSGGMEDKDLYNKTVYLASALRRYFGLSVKSVLCTMSFMSDDKKEKAETLGINVIARDVFEKDNYLDEITKILKINPVNPVQPC